MNKTLGADGDADLINQRDVHIENSEQCHNVQSPTSNEDCVTYFTRSLFGVEIVSRKDDRTAHQHMSLYGSKGQTDKQQSNKRQNTGSDNEEYMVCFTRRKPRGAVEETPCDRADYTIVMTSDGDFAARCLDTGYVIAGYDHMYPELPIETAAQRIFDRQDVYRIYVRGDFSTVMCRIINEYYDRLRQKYGIWSKEVSVKRFPVGKIRPDQVLQAYL